MPSTLACQDVMQWAETYQGEKSHAMICDPPYHLSGGFMGAPWDKDGPEAIAFRPETWAALARHLLPGAFIMAFASSRGWHRLACAMEDAGLVIHPSIFNYRTGEVLDIGMYGWSQGAGFPKATRIDNQVDRTNGHVFEDRYALGAAIKASRQARGFSESEVSAWLGSARKCAHYESLSPGFARVPTPDDWVILKTRLQLDSQFDGLVDRCGAERGVIDHDRAGAGGGMWSSAAPHGGFYPEYDLTAPATPLAQTWAGHRYGGQALKPALEPIIVAQVPYQGRPVDSITRTGAGALWIEGGRIAGPEPHHNYGRTSGEHGFAGESTTPFNTPTSGRWPANFCLQHLPNCQPLGTRQVHNGSGPPGMRTLSTYAERGGLYTPGRPGGTQHYAATDGTETVPVWDCADGCPVRTLDIQAGERIAAPSGPAPAGTFFSGLGRQWSHDATYTGVRGYPGEGTHASRFFHVSDWSLDVAAQLAQADPVYYCPKASASERHSGVDGRNTNPCIKPLTLCTWLATLLLPPAAYAPRRLLVPFAGTGSEIVGGVLAGWDIVVGIERDPAYSEIARKRIAYWTGYTVPTPTQSNVASQETTVPPGAGQLNLF
jgi:hypothetical protein